MRPLDLRPGSTCAVEDKASGRPSAIAAPQVKPVE